jgi:hypothetical protein
MLAAVSAFEGRVATPFFVGEKKPVLLQLQNGLFQTIDARYRLKAAEC